MKNSKNHYFFFDGFKNNNERKPFQCRLTIAMAEGLTKRFMSIEDIAWLVAESSQQKRGFYKKKSFQIT